MTIFQLNGYEDIVEDAIGVQPLARMLPGFGSYLAKLTPENNERNPWFKEYWEDHFKCSLKDPECSKNKLK